jgi:hypothetical protein
MLIYTDFNKPYLIESLTSPVVPKYYWIFSGHMLDFTLSPIQYLEETTGPSITVEINKLKFDVPAHWNILITDNDTWQLDTVPISSCANKKTLAYIMSPNDFTLRTAEIKIVDYCDHKSLVHPLLNKGTGLCHPVGSINTNEKEIDIMVILTPYDLYKFIGNKAVGDIIP